MTKEIKSHAHKMSKHEQHLIEIGVLIVGAIILFLYLYNQNNAAAPAAVTAPGTSGPAQPVNLNFQTPPINVTLAGGYESGYIPLFGFLGTGPFA